jgi:hypothetical protein
VVNTRAAVDVEAEANVDVDAVRAISCVTSRVMCVCVCCVVASDAC